MSFPAPSGRRFRAALFGLLCLARLGEASTARAQEATLEGPAPERPDWCVHAGAPVAAPPVSDAAGRLYVATTDGYVHSFTGAGHYRWSFTVSGAIAGSPVVRPSDGTVWVGTTARRVFAITATGRLGWALDTVAPVLTGLVRQTDGTLLYGAGAFVYAVSSGGGARWRVPVGAPVSVAPAPAPGGVLWVTAGSELLRLEGAWRTQRFPLEAEAWTPPLPLPGGVAVLTGDELVVFSDQGERRWSRSGVLGAQRDGAGSLALVDARGAVQWRAPDGQLLHESPVALTAPLAGAPAVWNRAAYLPLHSGEIVEVPQGPGPGRRWQLPGGPVTGLGVDEVGRRLLAALAGGRICSVRLVE